MTLKTLTHINNRPVIVDVKPKPCRCEAYDFPHRIDSKKCREMYNEQAKEEAEWHAYLKQRGVNDIAMHQSGMKKKDFG